MESGTTNQVFLYAIVVNGIIGAALGLVPLIAGIKRGKTRLGVIGLAAATVGGIVLGLILSLPAAGIFTWLIFRAGRSRAAGTAIRSCPECHVVYDRSVDFCLQDGTPLTDTES